MKLIIAMTMILLTASCASGDFQDIAKPLCVEHEETARYLLVNERRFVVDLNVHNELAGGC